MQRHLCSVFVCAIARGASQELLYDSVYVSFHNQHSHFPQPQQHLPQPPSLQPVSEAVQLGHACDALACGGLPGNHPRGPLHIADDSASSLCSDHVHLPRCDHRVPDDVLTIALPSLLHTQLRSVAFGEYSDNELDLAFNVYVNCDAQQVEADMCRCVRLSTLGPGPATWTLNYHCVFGLCLCLVLSGIALRNTCGWLSAHHAERSRDPPLFGRLGDFGDGAQPWRPARLPF
eukprot:3874287-Amphidinium_carterae.2